jgi:6-phosphogluconolactonase
MNRIEAFADHEALADAAATVIAQALGAPEAKSFIATGGTTPGPTYDRLARRDIDWGQIIVTLSDERWVAPTAPESNERLVRTRLLKHCAATARFLPLKGHGASPEEDAAAAEMGLRTLTPFAAVLLGMGADGHVASLFPGAAGLAAALDPTSERLCIGVDKAGLDPRVPRISLTARALLSSALAVVLITGEEKRAVVEQVGNDSAFQPPVAAILRQERVPVRVLWAP